MKKLTLNLDALQVESFEPSPARKRSVGTVKAHEYTFGDCLTYPDDQITRGDSCLHTRCGVSCDGACPSDDPYRLCGSATEYDPSCQGTCEGRPTCAVPVCVPL
ncbi:MAG TPA: hypothetical protein VEX86_25310 [Longimicrobium sp.]|nr:hypothetical protein [Longimicrobium sp.]